MNPFPRLTMFVVRLLVPLGSLLWSAGAFAVSLGDEMILSRLGDPVEVEVEVLQWEDMDLDRVQISAASREEYEIFKLTWLPVLEHLDFNLIGPDVNGKVRVLISSRDPLDEPFLELLLVLRWPGGSLRREYVLLFDPPGAPVPEQAVAAAAPEEKASQVAPEPEPAVVAEEPIAEEPVAEPDARTQVAIEVETLAPQAAASTLDTTRRTYQVRSGESLWNIARQFLPAGAGDNLYQMLVGLHDLNRNAFINGNISLLRANALLQVPTQADIAAIDPATAQAEFDRRWDAGTQRFDAAQRGEAIPLFVDETPVDEPAAPIEPDLPPGTEAPRPAAGDGGLVMVSATNAALPLQLAPAGDATIEPDAVATNDEPPIAALPRMVPAEPASSAEGAGNSPAMLSTASAARPAVSRTPAEAPTGVVTTTVELETEVAAMRARREAAEAIARQLQESLQRAQAERAAQAGLLAPQNLPLAAGALALVVALVAGVVFMLKIAGELRTVQLGNDGAIASRRAPTRLDARPVNPVRAEPARTEPTWRESFAKAPEAPDPQDPTQIEVVEMEPETANAAAASSADAADPKDLFARMDNMLGATQKSPQK